MRLILHIGMGKTGTSSIQKALAESAEPLAGQGVRYLGMWFGLGDPAFRGLQNQMKFFQSPPEELAAMAERFHAAMAAEAETRGIHSFVLSNEAISGHAAALQAFLEPLRDRVEIRVIGYVRNPHDWLPSAYVQWGVRDKTNTGPVLPYPEMAARLVHWYRGLLDWAERMPDLLEVRSYDAAPDVVQDFAAAAGIPLAPLGERVLERGEPGEIVLRALFNARFEPHTLPHVFNRMVLRDTRRPPRLEQVLAALFDYSATPEIVAAHGELFEQYRSRFGLDLLSEPKRPPAPPDPAALRERLVDYLLEVSLDQARRITHLENRLQRLAQDLAQDTAQDGAPDGSREGPDPRPAPPAEDNAAR